MIANLSLQNVPQQQQHESALGMHSHPHAMNASPE